jgi:cytoskeletal protein RodZ
MREIGRMLREARQAKGISLPQAEELTKIRLRYLMALEEGDLSGLPGRVYAIGYLRSYARCLGIDARTTEKMVEELRRAMEAREEEEAYPGIAGTERSRQRVWRLGRDVRRAAGVAVAVILVLVVSLAVAAKWFWGREKVTLPEPAAATGHTVVREERKAEIPQPEPSETGVELVILADKGPSWLEVAVDGRKVFEGMLMKGRETSFSAKESIGVKFGDAGAVTVKVNGQDIGPVGRRGQVLRKEFRASTPS